MNPVLHELVEPYPWLEFPELWFHIHHRGRRWLDAWKWACQRAIQSGSAEELHSVRNEYEMVLRGHLKMIDGWLMICAGVNGEFRVRELSERLMDQRDMLQRHYDSLFPRWQTLEDLEALLLETVSPTHDQLKSLAATHAPPQSWYDECSAPLTFG